MTSFFISSLVRDTLYTRVVPGPNAPSASSGTSEHCPVSPYGGNVTDYESRTKCLSGAKRSIRRKSDLAELALSNLVGVKYHVGYGLHTRRYVQSTSYHVTNIGYASVFRCIRRFSRLYYDRCFEEKVFWSSERPPSPHR